LLVLSVIAPQHYNSIAGKRSPLVVVTPAGFKRCESTISTGVTLVIDSYIYAFSITARAALNAVPPKETVAER